MFETTGYNTVIPPPSMYILFTGQLGDTEFIDRA